MTMQNPIIIDIEASGFGSNSYPIEIGLILEDKTKYCTLVRPESSWNYWDDSAEDVHQLTRKKLFSHGRTPAVVAQQLNTLLKGKTIYSDGWVVDHPWLIKLFEVAGIEMEFKLSSIELILKEQQVYLWDETKVEVIQDLDIRRHRASNDAHVVQETFLRTYDQISTMSA
ncbi:hypothetical protein ACXJY6_12155 [Vibrio sp. RC27]